MAIPSIPSVAIHRIQSSSATPEINKHGETITHKTQASTAEPDTEITALTRQFQTLKSMSDVDSSLVKQAKLSLAQSTNTSSETIAEAILTNSRSVPNGQ